MKKDIHPEMHPVVFVDGEHEIATTSTLTSDQTKDIDGVEHYVIPIEISSYTHPFFTGEQRIVDTAGQVERFMRRLEAGEEQREQERERKRKKREAERAAKRRRRGLTPIQARKELEAEEEAAAEAEAEAEAETEAEPSDDSEGGEG